MNKTLCALLMTSALLVLGQTAVSAGYYQGGNDEAVLRELVRDWANAVVHGDLGKLDRIQTDDFKGNAQGIGFNKRMLRAALQSKEMQVAAWSVDDVKVKITGNTALVTGRSTLTNAKYKGMDFSGNWEWSNRFVKQKDGTWRAVTSQAKLLKK